MSDAVAPLTITPEIQIVGTCDSSIRIHCQDRGRINKAVEKIINGRCILIALTSPKGGRTEWVVTIIVQYLGY